MRQSSLLLRGAEGEAQEIGIRPSRWGLLTTLFAVLVVAVIFTWFISRSLPGDGSSEAGFARDMVVHHAQAVEMAEIVRDKTENEGVRTLAKDITLTQQAQIGQMQGWLAVWQLPATGTQPAMAWMGHPTKGRMPGMASPAEINRLRSASSEEADALFLQLMIPHHRAAIPMSEAILERTGRSEVRYLATAIEGSQKKEIELMQDLLHRMEGSHVDGVPTTQPHHRDHR